MIEVTTCPAGHHVSFDRPWWKRAAALRTKAIAECMRCKTSAHWRELDARIANSRRKDAEERQRDLARRQEEATAVTQPWPTDDMSWASRATMAPLHSGGGGVFDGGGASGRWGLAEPPAANDLPPPAPSPSYDSSSASSSSYSSSDSSSSSSSDNGSSSSSSD